MLPILVTNLCLYLLYNYNTPSIVIYLITRFFVCCAFCIYYTYCLESYPTSIAQIAYGINGLCNCLGGIVVPFIVEYVEKKTFYLIYFIFAIVCVLLMIFLKETNGKPIPEQIKEIEEEENKKNARGYSCCYCINLSIIIKVIYNIIGRIIVLFINRFISYKKNF